MHQLQQQNTRLFGTIEEIRTGADSSSGDEAPDICCTFDLPALSRNVQALERFLTQRRGTPVKAEELPLERIAMKPEMITPLAIPEQDYPKLALYIVDTNWAVDGESGSYEVVFTLHQDALRSSTTICWRSETAGALSNGENTANSQRRKQLPVMSAGWTAATAKIITKSK